MVSLAPARTVPTKLPPGSQGYGSGKVLKPDFDELVRHSHLIVLGKVIRVGKIDHPGPVKGRSASRKYAYWEDRFAILEIEKTIKGNASRRTIRIAFHSDLEGDKTDYQSGRQYLTFLIRPTKYPDAYTTAHFHYGEYRINDQGKAERVADPSEISKPPGQIIENIRKAMNPPGKRR